MLLTTMMRTALATVLVAAFVAVLPLRAWSHPSDFETLTIDLLFGAEGLNAIDAAVVESSGPGYEPGPSVELREAVATQVLDALNLSQIPTNTDLENSERYHWVGFTIRFPDPALDGRSHLEIDTQPLQDIAAEIGLKYLKLTICKEFSDSVDPRDDFRLGVSRPEGVGCEGWILTPEEPPVTLTVPIQDELPMTGLPMEQLMVAALALMTAGFAIVIVRERLRRIG